MTAPTHPSPPPDTGLAGFLARHRDSGLDVLEAALRAECAARGFWVVPEAAGAPGHASHLVEICAFGLWSYGMTTPEAVRAWRTRALAETAPASHLADDTRGDAA